MDRTGAQYIKWSDPIKATSSSLRGGYFGIMEKNMETSIQGLGFGGHGLWIC